MFYHLNGKSTGDNFLVFRNWDFRGLSFGKALGVKVASARNFAFVAVSCGSYQTLTGLCLSSKIAFD